MSAARISARMSRSFSGVARSWGLLSLGTPFWFNLLKHLFNLRSILAQKDDKERADRQVNIPPEKLNPQAAGTVDQPKTIQAMEGEMGDLDQTGAVG